MDQGPCNVEQSEGSTAHAAECTGARARNSTASLH